MKKLGLALVLLLATLAAGGFLLPRHVSVERAAGLPASPEAVWAHIGTLERWRDWEPWSLGDPSVIYTFEGPAEGVGATLIWSGEGGGGRMSVTSSEPPHRLVLALSFDDGEKQATNRFVLTPIESGTRVIWSHEADMGAGPFGRYVGLMMDGAVGPWFERGLGRLRGVLASTP